MLKQKARAVALGVLGGDLALTAVSLPVAYALRERFLPALLPRLVPSSVHPFELYVVLLGLVLPLWGLLLYAAGFYRSHRTLPLAEEIWAAMKVAFGGTAVLAVLI